MRLPQLGNRNRGWFVCLLLAVGLVATGVERGRSADEAKKPADKKKTDDKKADDKKADDKKAADKDEKKSRVLFKALGLVYPKLRDRSGKDQERNDVILRWLRLLTAKDQKRQTAGKQRKNEYFRIQGAFQVAHQFTA